MQLLAQIRREIAALPPPDPQARRRRPEAQARAGQARASCCKLLAEIEKRINDENARPKKRYISPATREEVYAIYYDSAAPQIEDRGTRNFPELAGTQAVRRADDDRHRQLRRPRASTPRSWSPRAIAPLDRRAQAIVRAAGAVRPLQRRDARAGRPDRRRLALQVHARRDAGNHADATDERGTRCDRYCVLGNPVEHSQSPWIHARFAAADRRSASHYGRGWCPLDGFAAAVRAFAAGGGTRLQRHRAVQVRGAARWPRSCSAARGAGRRRQHPALRRATAGSPTTPTASAWCATSSTTPASRWPAADVLLIGAGGAAAGVLGPLLDGRPRRVVVANRTPDKAPALVQRHAALARAHGVDAGRRRRWTTPAAASTW